MSVGLARLSANPAGRPRHQSLLDRRRIAWRASFPPVSTENDQKSAANVVHVPASEKRCASVLAEQIGAPSHRLQRYEAARLNRTSRIVQTAFERLDGTRDELADPNLANAFMERLASASGDPHDWIYQYAVSAPM